mmetsp:Transcript_40840/g.102810  ORF Transcript_40840/g.102810 Transcript_40840/m.102810 type:complete len:642 (-) Transcript_40840:82-2007(-)
MGTYLKDLLCPDGKPKLELADLWNQLQELKEQYHKKKLEICKKIAPEEEVPSGFEKSEKKVVYKKSGRLRSGTAFCLDPSEPTLTQLQHLLRKIILQHGGSAHFDTLMFCVEKKYPALVNNIPAKAEDEDPSTSLKKRVLDALESTSNTYLFEKDPKTADSYIMSPLECDIFSESRPISPVVDKIQEFIENNGGFAASDAVVRYLQKTWNNPIPMKAEELTSVVETVLSSNRLFEVDGKDPTVHFIASYLAMSRKRNQKRDKRVVQKKKRKEPPAVTESPQANSTSTAATVTSTTTSTSTPSSSSNKRNTCRCSGKNQKFRKGPTGERVCSSCGKPQSKESRDKQREKAVGKDVRDKQTPTQRTDGKKERRDPGPSGGKKETTTTKAKEPASTVHAAQGSMPPPAPPAPPPKKKRPAPSSRPDEKKKDTDPWIQCDLCNKWVRAKTDTSISDISLYDDDNPNHLDYFCPRCREKDKKDGSSVKPRPAATARKESNEATSAPRRSRRTSAQDLGMEDPGESGGEGGGKADKVVNVDEDGPSEQAHELEGLVDDGGMDHNRAVDELVERLVKDLWGTLEKLRQGDGASEVDTKEGVTKLCSALREYAFALCKAEDATHESVFKQCQAFFEAEKGKLVRQLTAK